MQDWGSGAGTGAGRQERFRSAGMAGLGRMHKIRKKIHAQSAEILKKDEFLLTKKIFFT